jgi:prepilin-type N-terminal cleavage/methylation domain-containing protein
MSRQHGQSLAELLCVVAILGILAAFALPAWSRALERALLCDATARIEELLAVTREEAIALDHQRGVKFRRSGDRWTFAVYDDGDGDGIRNDDIDSGVDPLVHGPEPLLFCPSAIAAGIPPGGLPDPDGGTRLTESNAPVQFNNSTICSFSRDGSATPGTVYLHARGGDAACIRSSGEGGALRVFFCRHGAASWSMSP